MRHFCCEKAAFFKFFGLGLTFENFFGLSFKKSGLDLQRKISQSAHLRLAVRVRANLT